MFDFGWTELLVIAVAAIIVIGPKDLPRTMRAVGQWTGRVRRMAREFQGQFNEALREAELDTVKREVQELGKIDPVGDMRKEMAKVEAGIKKDMDVKLPDEAKDADGTGANATPEGSSKPAEAPKAEPAAAAVEAPKPKPAAKAEPVAADTETGPVAKAPAKRSAASTKAKPKAKPRKAKAPKPAAPKTEPASSAAPAPATEAKT